MGTKHLIYKPGTLHAALPPFISKPTVGILKIAKEGIIPEIIPIT